MLNLTRSVHSVEFHAQYIYSHHFKMFWAESDLRSVTRRKLCPFLSLYAGPTMIWQRVLPPSQENQACSYLLHAGINPPSSDNGFCLLSKKVKRVITRAKALSMSRPLITILLIYWMEIFYFYLMALFMILIFYIHMIQLARYVPWQWRSISSTSFAKWQPH